MATFREIAAHLDESFFFYKYFSVILVVSSSALGVRLLLLLCQFLVPRL